jgi:hypothetical protein
MLLYNVLEGCGPVGGEGTEEETRIETEKQLEHARSLERSVEELNLQLEEDLFEKLKGKNEQDKNNK